MPDRPLPSGSASFARYAVRSVIALACVTPACGDKGGDAGKATAGTVAKTEPTKTDAEPIVAASGAAKAEGGDAKADTGDAKAEGSEAKADGGDANAEGGDAKAEGGDAKAEGGDAKADTGEGGAADPTAGVPADPKALFTEVKNKKTKDDRALAALAEAEAAGAKLRDVAAAANARGEKLFEDPERAKTFFEWAAAKDPKYPEPEFNLAKQAVITGDIDLVNKHLNEVKARGGKKLLGQIEYDATWELVKDDPNVRKLLGG
jgi:hypothetical protein